MGSICSCFVSSDESSCASALGSCKNQHCASSCSKKVQQEAVQLEEVVDAVLKKWIDDHLHKYLRENLSSPVARQIEEGVMDVINTDFVPRLSVNVVEGKSASDEKQLQSPSI